MKQRYLVQRLCALAGIAVLSACTELAPRAVERADTPRVAVPGTASGPPSVQPTVTMAPTAPYDSAAEASSAPMGADEAEEFVPPVELAPEARATCDSMAAAWQPVPGVRLTTVDKIVQLGGGDIIGFRGADDDKPWVRACVVEAYVAQDEGSVGHVRRVHRGAGWVELVRISADGPEGGSTTHQGGRTRCHLLRRVPFGDGPEDTTRLAPFYLERATCWTHWSDVTPADTANGFPG